jgi:hypothetical protein
VAWAGARSGHLIPQRLSPAGAPASLIWLIGVAMVTACTVRRPDGALSGVTTIAAGAAALLQVSSAAIRSDSTLWTWGL